MTQLFRHLEAAQAFRDCPLSFSTLRDIQRPLSGGVLDVRGPEPEHPPRKTHL
jgi:hypothetical protein